MTYGKFEEGILHYYFADNKPNGAKPIINQIPEYDSAAQYVEFVGMIENEDSIAYNYEVKTLESATA